MFGRTRPTNYRPGVVTPDGKLYQAGRPNYAEPAYFGAPIGSTFAMIGALTFKPVVSAGYLLGAPTAETVFGTVGALPIAQGITVQS